MKLYINTALDTLKKALSLLCRTLLSLSTLCRGKDPQEETNQTKISGIRRPLPNPEAKKSISRDTGAQEDTYPVYVPRNKMTPFVTSAFLKYYTALLRFFCDVGMRYVVLWSSGGHSSSATLVTSTLALLDFFPNFNILSLFLTLPTRLPTLVAVSGR